MPDAPARKPRRKRNPDQPRHPTGRHHELDRVIQIRDGRNVTAEEAAIERIAAGIPLIQAAGGLGIRMQTIHDWRRKGVRARARQIAGEVIESDDELRMISFADKCDEAEARAFSTEWIRHGTVAAGGLERVTVTQRQVLDGDGKILTLQDRKTETMLPDAKAIQWRLGVRFGMVLRQQVEVTGADGGPVELEVVDVAAAGLARRFSEFVEAATVEVKALPPGATERSEAAAAVRVAMADLPSPDENVPPPGD